MVALAFARAIAISTSYASRTPIVLTVEHKLHGWLSTLLAPRQFAMLQGPDAVARTDGLSGRPVGLQIMYGELVRCLAMHILYDLFSGNNFTCLCTCDSENLLL